MSRAMLGGSVGVEHRTLRALVFGEDMRASQVLLDIFLDELDHSSTKQLNEKTPYAVGVFLLYYIDTSHHVYSRLDTTRPVYIGHAQSNMSSRIQSLALSIRQTSALKYGNFRVCILPVDIHFVACAEQLLLAHFKPLWNCVITGIGNHAPGKGRTSQARSDWDMLHPGRSWAMALPPSSHSQEQLWAKVEEWLAES